MSGGEEGEEAEEAPTETPSPHGGTTEGQLEVAALSHRGPICDYFSCFFGEISTLGPL